MSARTLLYIAAVLLLLFALGHTIGFLTFHPKTAVGQAAWIAMQTAVLMPGHTNTWAGFYMGFGLFVTLFFVFAFVLARSSAEAPRVVATVTFALATTMLGSLVLSIAYFSMPPIVFSAVLLVVLLWAGARLQRAA